MVPRNAIGACCCVCRSPLRVLGCQTAQSNMPQRATRRRTSCRRMNDSCTSKAKMLAGLKNLGFVSPLVLGELTDLQALQRVRVTASPGGCSKLPSTQSRSCNLAVCLAAKVRFRADEARRLLFMALRSLVMPDKAEDSCSVSPSLAFSRH